MTWVVVVCAFSGGRWYCYPCIRTAVDDALVLRCCFVGFQLLEGINGANGKIVPCVCFNASLNCALAISHYC